MQDRRFVNEPSMTGFTGDPDDYIPVSERLAAFRAEHPGGRIITTIVEHRVEDGFVLMRTEIFRAVDDACPAATGHAFEYRDSGDVNWTSYIENCETSVVGRALAMLGYCVNRGIASREEMEKVVRHNGNNGQHSHNGHSQPVDHRPPASPFYEWTETRKGKPVLMLKPDQNLPEKVECRIHRGSMLTLRTNNNGSWLSHRQGDGYCSADIRYQPRPQAGPAELRARLVEHNRNGRTAT